MDRHVFRQGRKIIEKSRWGDAQKERMEMYFYDKLRREVVTGIYKGMMSYSSSASVEFAPDKPNNHYGYLFSSYLKMDSLNIQKVAYYDTYQYKRLILASLQQWII